MTARREASITPELTFGLVTYCGVFNPVLATHRLEQTAPDRVARTLATWSASGSLTIAALTALCRALPAGPGRQAAQPRAVPAATAGAGS